MTLYLFLNLGVMAALCIAPVLLPTAVHWRAVWITLGILVGTTIVFDSLIIATGIVGYDLDAILGIYIVRAPIEDFAYAVVAALFVPYLWERIGKK